MEHTQVAHIYIYKKMYMFVGRYIYTEVSGAHKSRHTKMLCCHTNGQHTQGHHILMDTTVMTPKQQMQAIAGRNGLLVGKGREGI